MKHLKSGFKCLLKDDSGQDLVEYALILALVTLGTVSALKNLAGSIGTAFGAVDSLIAGTFT